MMGARKSQLPEQLWIASCPEEQLKAHGCWQLHPGVRDLMVNNGIGSRPGCVFCDGNHDIVLEPELPIIGLEAPEYLSIEGHEDCLGTYNPSPSYTAKCLPSTRPDRCIPPAWQELQQKYDGKKCPEQPVIGGIGGLPPAYLSIRGHE